MGDLHILAQNGNIKGIRAALKNKKAFLSLLILLGLTFSSEVAPKRIKKLYPLFGHFYPDKSSMIVSTNNLWVPNSRYGSGIR